MPLLKDISVGAAGDDPNEKIDKLVKQLNEWGRAISNEDRTDITKDDAGIQRLLIGYQQNGFSNGSVGVKLSQEGTDVLGATSDELIWSTEFNNFKILEKVVVPLDVVLTGTGSKTASATVSHGYSFTPSYIAFITIDPLIIALSPLSNVNGPNPFLIMGTASPLVVYGFFQVGVDATDITFSAQVAVGGSATLSNSATVYLLRETAT